MAVKPVRRKVPSKKVFNLQDALPVEEMRKYKRNVFISTFFLILCFVLLGLSFYVLNKVRLEKQAMLAGVNVSGSSNDMKNTSQQQNMSGDQTSGYQSMSDEFKNSQEVLTQFYDALKDSKFTDAQNYLDYTLKGAGEGSRYFNTARFQKFFGAVEEFNVTGIEEGTGDTSSPNVKVYDYTISYSLTKESKDFSEQWKAYLRKKPNGDYTINQLQCVSKGCSFNPFFNPDKFGIK